MTVSDPKLIDLKEIIGDYDPVIANVSRGLVEAGIDRSEVWGMDHLCYRVETLDRYVVMKQELGRVGLLISESAVAGRNIAIFKLAHCIDSGGWLVPFIELPEPKPGSDYVEGLEHAELMVVRGLAEFQNNHADLAELFDKKALTRPLNPELGLKAFGMSVKFHELSIGAVIGLEERLAAAELPTQ